MRPELEEGPFVVGQFRIASWPSSLHCPSAPSRCQALGISEPGHVVLALSSTDA